MPVRAFGEQFMPGRSIRSPQATGSPWLPYGAPDVGQDERKSKRLKQAWAFRFHKSICSLSQAPLIRQRPGKAI